MRSTESLAHPAQVGGPRCGLVRGVGVELGRAEGGSLERECRGSVETAEADACPVEHR